MKKVMMTSDWGIWIKRPVAALVAVIAAYCGAALLGSIIPTNPQWQSPPDGIQLYIETNGVHTGIVMPIKSDVHDWSDIIQSSHLSNPSRYGSHILVGWGHAGVYQNTEKWTDLRSGDAFSAVFGSDETLMHVYHLTYPQNYPHYRRGFKVSEKQYRRLVKAISAQFAIDANGRVDPIKGYGSDDVFYTAKGHYNAVHTCNSWTSAMLRQAGIRAGSWTPFAGGVMRWFPER